MPTGDISKPRKTSSAIGCSGGFPAIVVHMGLLRALGFSRNRLPGNSQPHVSHVLQQRPLRRVLEFTGHTIDEVVNSRLVKNEVLGYYKLHKFVQRGCEVTELERQWGMP